MKTAKDIDHSVARHARITRMESERIKTEKEPSQSPSSTAPANSEIHTESSMTAMPMGDSAGSIAAPHMGVHDLMASMSPGAAAFASSDEIMSSESTHRAMPPYAAMPTMSMLRPSPGGPFGQAETPGATATAPMDMGNEAMSNMATDRETLATGLSLHPDIEPSLQGDSQALAKKMLPSDIPTIAVRGKVINPRVAIDDSDDPVEVIPRRTPPPVRDDPTEPLPSVVVNEYEEPEPPGSPDAMTVLIGIGAALAWMEYEKAWSRRARARDRVAHLEWEEDLTIAGGMRVDPPDKCPPLPFFSEFPSPATADGAQSSQTREDLCEVSGSCR